MKCVNVPVGKDPVLMMESMYGILALSVSLAVSTMVSLQGWGGGPPKIVHVTP